MVIRPVLRKSSRPDSQKLVMTFITNWNCRRSWRLGETVFESFAPLPQGNSNDRSCVLLITQSGRRVLLTGDIESKAEQQLADMLGAPVDLMSVPHHGSSSSSEPAMLNVAMPDVAARLLLHGVPAVRMRCMPRFRLEWVLSAVSDVASNAR